MSNVPLFLLTSPWPSVSAAAASYFKMVPHIVVHLIRSAHTLRGLCISALWLLEKLFNYWELLRRGVTATRKRFLSTIGCSETSTTIEQIDDV
jgi:hypothetical protein